MSEVSKRYAQDEAFREVANLLFGAGATELIEKFDQKDHRQRKVTAGLSAVGAGAGVVGLAAAGNEIKHRAKTLGSLKAGYKATPKLTRALIPIEVAGLGGEIMATKILHNDTKKKVSKSEPCGPDLHVPAPQSRKGKLVRAVGNQVEPRVREKVKEKIGKGFIRNIKQTAENAERASRHIADLSEKANKATHPGAIGAAAAGAGVVGAGSYGAGYGMGRKGKLTPTKKRVKKNDDTFEITKMDTDKRQVFGWASIVKKDGQDVIDLQGDYIAIDEVEKSAYEYVIKSRQGGDMHQRNGEAPKVVGTMIESFVLTPEKIEKMGLPDSTPLGWWVGYKVEDDEVWNLVKSGKRTGFSIHGRGNRTPTEM